MDYLTFGWSASNLFEFLCFDWLVKLVISESTSPVHCKLLALRVYARCQ